MVTNYQDTHPVAKQMDSGWLRPTRDQKTVVYATTALALVAQMQVGPLASVPIIVIGVLLYAPVYGGRKGVRRSGIDGVIGGIERARIRRRGGNLYSYNLKDTLLNYDSANFRYTPEREKSAFPAELISISPRDGNGGRFNFLRNKTSSGDKATAVLLFDGGPKFINSDPSQRAVWDQVFTSALKRGVNTTMEPIDMSLFVIARSADPTEPVAYAEERWHSDFHGAEDGTLEYKQVANALEDAERIYLGGTRYFTGVAISMDFPKKWRRKDLNELTLDQILSTPFMGVVSTIQSNLQGAVTGLRLPNLFELNEVVYMLANATDLGAFYAQQRKDVASEKNGEFKSLEDAVTLKRGPFPGSIQVSNDCMIANRTFHSTVAVTGFEDAHFTPGFLDSLFQQSYPFVFSHYLQTLPYKSGMRSARTARRLQAAGGGLLHGKRNRDLHPEDAESEQEAELRHMGLFFSKSRSTLSRIQVTVQGESYDECQTNVQRMTGDLSNHAALSVQYLGEHVQVEPLYAHLCLFDE